MNIKTGMFAIAGLIQALITAAILVVSVAPLPFIYRRMSA